MNKFVVAFGLGLAAVALVATGTAFAQTAQPPVPGAGAGLGNGSGPLYAYIVKALAQALGVSVDEFEARRATGETAYQIAVSEGIAAGKIPTLISQGRASAIDAAVADGVLTQAQATWMKARGAQMGAGNCSGAGPQRGSGMLGRGARWQQGTP